MYLSYNSPNLAHKFLHTFATSSFPPSYVNLLLLLLRITPTFVTILPQSPYFSLALARYVPQSSYLTYLPLYLLTANFPYT